MFEAAQLRTILDALDGKPIKLTPKPEDGKQGEEKEIKLNADPALRAMLLLGLNCGFGNTDCASLPRAAVDLDAGWIDFPRPKTEIHRRVPLWPETIDALRKALDLRPEPADQADADLCFLTKRGNRWVRTARKDSDDPSAPESYTAEDAISKRFGKLLHTLGINGRRGLGFYTLRHVFETIGGESRDQVAVDAIMGHVDSSMAGVYRERISDDRLQAVVATVRAWVFGT